MKYTWFYLSLLLAIASACTTVEPTANLGTQVCGDSILTDPEECDDGNRESGDGCSALCVKESTTTGGTPAGSEGGTPAGAQGGTPAGSEGGTPAGAQGGTPAGSEGGTPAGSEGGTPAGAQGGTPAGSEGGTPAGSEGGTPAGSEGGTPAGSEGGTPAGSEGGNQPVSVCGNGVREGAEACDDGNNLNNDGCSSACVVEMMPPRCGNGILEGAEACDDGNLFNGDGCSAQCTIEIPMPRCGNGMREGTEECDDGNLFNNDGCSSQCITEVVPARCGNGMREGAEACDDGNLNNGDGCSAQCTVEAPQARCGNGMREGAEACDDGNLNNGDGCSAQCTVEAPQARCGNGIREGAEACDDGNLNNGDGCSAQCTVEAPQARCGNGIREGVEICDDGNLNNGDGCSAQCTVEAPQPRCGNGVREGTEACDDGNLNNGDGCSAQCTVEAPSCVPTDAEIEENSTLALATAFTGIMDGQICAGDQDWFIIPSCGNGGRVTVSVEFTHSNGDIDIELFDGNQQLLTSSSGTGDVEAVVYQNAGATSNVYLRVFGFAAAMPAVVNSYRITANYNCTFAADNNDRILPNDSANQATRITRAQDYPLSITSGDVDYFKTNLCRSGTLIVSTIFSDIFGDLDITLYDENENFLGNAVSTEDNETLFYDNRTGGFQTVLVKVYGVGADSNEYILNVDQFGCDDDLYEDNRNAGTARGISTGAYDNLVLLPTDEDWYQIPLQIPAHSYTFELSYTYSPFGDLELEILDENMNSLCISNTSTSLDRCIYYHAYTFNSLYVRVYGFLDSQNQYRLTIQ